MSRSAYLLTGDHHLTEDLLQPAFANTASSATSAFDLTESDRLAGKGAWTPDGSGLVTVHGEDSIDGGGDHHFSWTFTVRGPATGAALRKPTTWPTSTAIWTLTATATGLFLLAILHRRRRR